MQVKATRPVTTEILDHFIRINLDLYTFTKPISHGHRNRKEGTEARVP